MRCCDLKLGMVVGDPYTGEMTGVVSMKILPNVNIGLELHPLDDDTLSIVELPWDHLLTVYG